MPRLVVDADGEVVRLDGLNVSPELVVPPVQFSPGQPPAPDAVGEEVIWDPASRISMDGVHKLSNSLPGSATGDGGGCGGDGGC